MRAREEGYPNIQLNLSTPIFGSRLGIVIEICMLCRSRIFVKKYHQNNVCENINFNLMKAVKLEAKLV